MMLSGVAWMPFAFHDVLEQTTACPIIERDRRSHRGCRNLHRIKTCFFRVATWLVNHESGLSATLIANLARYLYQLNRLKVNRLRAYQAPQGSIRLTNRQMEAVSIPLLSHLLHSFHRLLVYISLLPPRLLLLLLLLPPPLLLAPSSPSSAAQSTSILCTCP